MAFMIYTVTNKKKKKESLYSKDLNKVFIARPLKLNVLSKICKKTSFNEWWYKTWYQIGFIEITFTK